MPIFPSQEKINNQKLENLNKISTNAAFPKWTHCERVKRIWEKYTTEGFFLQKWNKHLQHSQNGQKIIVVNYIILLLLRKYLTVQEMSSEILPGCGNMSQWALLSIKCLTLPQSKSGYAFLLIFMYHTFCSKTDF